MPLHIGELTSNVTVTQGADDRAITSAPVTEAVVPAAERLPPLEMVLSQTTAEPAEPESVVSSNQQETEAPGRPAPVVDPKALADRVYRMMRDDLIIARERE